MDYLRLKFCGGVGTVTGANFLLEAPKGKILIDCGLVQGEKVAMEINSQPFLYDPRSIDVLIVTHAHLDHVGRIPKLVKEGFHGVIYSTPQTKELASLVLNDAVQILAHEANTDGLEPLYSVADVQNVFPLWQTIDYHQSFDVVPGVTAYLKDAGHILGSAMVEVRADSESILFTGDLGNSPAPLLADTELVGSVDHLVMESVYGDRNHEDKEGVYDRFKQIILDSISRGGTLVIPAFAIDRTQILLYELNRMVEKGDIPSIPVYLDSPMAIKATEIYGANTELFNEKVRGEISRGDDVFKFPRLKFTVSADESRVIEETNGPKIVIAGSGMSVGGRVVGHERKYLDDARNTIMLVGYQAAGSLGRQLADGAKKIKIYRDVIKVKARVEKLYGYSAHRDSDHLVQFVSTGDPRLKQIFVVMGEPGASMHLAQRLNEELGVEATVPPLGGEFSLV